MTTDLKQAHAFLDEIADDMQFLDGRQDQLLAFRQYGDYLTPLDDMYKTEEYYVHGCASATHVRAILNDDNTVTFEGDSQSFISKGYIYLLTKAFNGIDGDVFLTESEPIVQEFIEKAQVGLSLVQSRANAFERIYRFMQKHTLAAIASKDNA